MKGVLHLKKIISLLLTLSLICGIAVLPASASGSVSGISLDSLVGIYEADESYDTIKGDAIKDYRVSFELTPEKIEYFGFYIRYKDEDNHVVAKLYGREGKVKLLEKVNGGGYKLLTEKKYSLNKGEKNKVEVEASANTLSVYINEELAAQTRKMTVSEGKTGINSVGSAVSISKVSFVEVEPPEDIVEVGKEYDIYVSPKGDDATGDGSEAKPFKTVEAAQRDAGMKKIGNSIVNIIFDDGVYELSAPITIDSSDSGTESAPVTYKAKNQGKAIFTGAKTLEISKFKPVTDKAVAARINKKAEGKVVQYDLNNLKLSKEVFAMDTGSEMLQNYFPAGVYLNDNKQSISRWPNDDWNYFTDVIDEGGTAQSVWTGQKKTDQVINKGAVFKYTEINPNLWESIDGAYLAGFLGTEYRNEWTKIRSLDKTNQTITLDHYTTYGVKPKHRWAVMNLLEEVDIPGEWCLDETNNILYYYPEHELTEDDKVEVTAMTSELLKINGAQNVIIDGLLFEKSRADGVKVSNASDVTIKNCEVKDFMHDGIAVEKSSNLIIDSNIVRNISSGAITFANCGDRKTLVNANIKVNNNLIYNYSNEDVYGQGVDAEIECVGIEVTKNTLSRCDGQAIDAGGVDRIITHNEIADSCRYSSDAASIYNGRRLSEYDTRIEYNFVHDYGALSDFATYAVSAVFLDDLLSGTIVNNNIIYANNYNTTRGVKVGGGRDNEVKNNTIVGVKGVFAVEHRINKNDIFTNNAYTPLLSDMNKGIDYTSSPWTDKHPGVNNLINELAEDGGYIQKNNDISGNVYFNCKGIGGITSEAIEYGHITDNVEVPEDIFVDSEKLDYRIKKEFKDKYNLSENLIYEDFDLDLIGSSVTPEVQKDFKMLYPADKAEGLETRDLWIAWEHRPYVNEYYYTVAEDPEFENVVLTGKSIKNCANLSGLENGKTYYWKVSAKNIIRRQLDEWESTSGVFSFTTAEKNSVVKVALNNLINKAKATAGTIKEGDVLGVYRKGTKVDFNTEIKRAMGVLNSKNAEQAEVDTAFSRLDNFIDSIPKYMNLGYVKVDIGTADKWIKQNYQSEITVTDVDGAVNFKRNNVASSIYQDKKYSGAEILCFDTRIEEFNGTWAGYTIKQTNPTVFPYTRTMTSSYFIVVKEDIIELQRCNLDKGVGGIITTVPNDYIKEGQWHSIQFGAVPSENGIYVSFVVDGKQVFAYNDVTAPFYEGGYFSIFPTGEGGSMSLRNTETIPTGEFVVPEPETEFVYNTSSAEFVSEGNVTKSENAGFEGATVFSSSDPTSSMAWDIDHGYGTQNYKVYIYHDPKLNTDTKASVQFLNYAMDQTVEIDMTTLKEGWNELGTYPFMSASVTQTGMMIFKPSGNGTLSISALKLEMVE